tara:strand:- start:3060 stop:5987 length:2928 start_codon:yes stop_codon:yes gene_type:complete
MDKNFQDINNKKNVLKKGSSYKETLNLLRTNFQMRANAVIREPELQDFWKRKKIDKLGLKGEKGKFTLHDGPPYANGNLHMGHALNKILKDIINKYKTLKGYKVSYTPGWDCHGLPIELKVLKNLKSEERKNLTIENLRLKAANYAKDQINSQMKGFQRWGIWGNWDNPYLTLQKEYESEQIDVFGKMVLNGFIYRGLKPVHWSPSSRTALAEAELEYPENHFSDSIYVAFSIVDIPQPIRRLIEVNGINLSTDENLLAKEISLIIWTTTPWTLPANQAVSINDSIEYAVIKDKDNRCFFIAKELISSLEEKTSNSYKYITSFKGNQLEGILYSHPFNNKKCPVVIGGEYINIDSGTGLVHTAPGHGMDDFNTGIKYNLEINCVVDEKGIMTESAGKFQGLNVLKDANDSIIASLIESKSLLFREKYNHKYPYDWRSKKPTIFRATEQWFASVSGFKENVLSSIEKVNWIPLSGKKRIQSMIQNRGDWCISRQRSWGVPIPVFYHKNNNEILLNQETIAHIKDLFRDKGADAWWTLNTEDLLPIKYKSEANLWLKGTDTMDVWFDSGSSWAAVCQQRQDLNYPADLYLEGSDQHRGWFQSSLLTSVAVNNQAPYKTVLTHGFTLDENGRKMSKSLGNIVDPYIIINGGPNLKNEPAYGADVLRLWVSSVDYSVDVPIGASILRQLSDVYRKVRNTSRYLLGNLYDYSPDQNNILIEDLPILDRWMLHKLGQVSIEIEKSYENFEFYKFFQILQSFCVVDLSNFYLDIAKDRLYVSDPSAFRRKSCQKVLSIVVEHLAGIISPVLCHMAEDIWQNLPYKVDEESVFLRGWPQINSNWIDSSLDDPIDDLRKLRNEINRVLELCRNKQFIGAGLESSVNFIPNQDRIKNSLDWLDHSGNSQVDDFCDWLIISKFSMNNKSFDNLLLQEETKIGLIQVSKAKGKKCERCWHYFEKNDLKDNIEDCLCNRCAQLVKVKT